MKRSALASPANGSVLYPQGLADANIRERRSSPIQWRGVIRASHAKSVGGTDWSGVVARGIDVSRPVNRDGHIRAKHESRKMQAEVRFAIRNIHQLTRLFEED